MEVESTMLVARGLGKGEMGIAVQWVQTFSHAR